MQEVLLKGIHFFLFKVCSNFEEIVILCWWKALIYSAIEEVVLKRNEYDFFVLLINLFCTGIQCKVFT